MGVMGGAGWGTGIVAGLLLGAAAAAALPLLERVSRCVKAGRLPPPGRFGLQWGRATPWAVVAGYVAYGAVMGGVLVAF
jgi:RsiW-degrading membrane proteinase PrsW (M82 family)